MWPVPGRRSILGVNRVLRSLTRTFAVLLALVLGIPVAVYVGFGVVRTVEQRHLDDAARGDLEASLPGAERDTRLIRARALAATARRGSPSYSWTEVICSFETDDAGWIVQDYRQQCQVHSVDLVPLTTSPGERCSSGPESYQPGYTTMTAPPSGLSSSDYADGCPVLLRASPGRSVLLAGRRPSVAALGSAPGWLVVEVRVEASSTLLGCSPWDVLFCSNPLDHPAMDEHAIGSIRSS